MTGFPLGGGTHPFCGQTPLSLGNNKADRALRSKIRRGEARWHSLTEGAIADLSMSTRTEIADTNSSLPTSAVGDRRYSSSVLPFSAFCPRNFAWINMSMSPSITACTLLVFAPLTVYFFFFLLYN